MRGILTRYNWITDLLNIIDAPLENFINANYVPLPQVRAARPRADDADGVDKGDTRLMLRIPSFICLIQRPTRFNRTKGCADCHVSTRPGPRERLRTSRSLLRYGTAAAALLFSVPEQRRLREAGADLLQQVLYPGEGHQQRDGECALRPLWTGDAARYLDRLGLLGSHVTT